MLAIFTPSHASTSAMLTADPSLGTSLSSAVLMYSIVGSVVILLFPSWMACMTCSTRVISLAAMYCTLSKSYCSCLYPTVCCHLCIAAGLLLHSCLSTICTLSMHLLAFLAAVFLLTLSGSMAILSASCSTSAGSAFISMNLLTSCWSSTHMRISMNVGEWSLPHADSTFALESYPAFHPPTMSAITILPVMSFPFICVLLASSAAENGSPTSSLFPSVKV